MPIRYKVSLNRLAGHLMRTLPDMPCSIVLEDNPTGEAHSLRVVPSETAEAAALSNLHDKIKEFLFGRRYEGVLSVQTIAAEKIRSGKGFVRRGPFVRISLLDKSIQ